MFAWILLFLMLFAWSISVYLIAAALLSRRQLWAMLAASAAAAALMATTLLFAHRLADQPGGVHNAVLDVAADSGTTEIRLTNLDNPSDHQRWRVLLNPTGDLEVQTGGDTPPWGPEAAANRLNINADASLVIIQKGGVTIGSQNGESGSYSFSIVNKDRDVVGVGATIESRSQARGNDGVAGSADDGYDLSFSTKAAGGALTARGGVTANGIWHLGTANASADGAVEGDAAFGGDLIGLREETRIIGARRAASEPQPGRDVTIAGGAAGGAGANRGGRVRLTTGAPSTGGIRPLVEIDASGDVPTPDVLAANHIGFRYSAADGLVAYVSVNGAIRSVPLGRAN